MFLAIIRWRNTPVGSSALHCRVGVVAPAARGCIPCAGLRQTIMDNCNNDAHSRVSHCSACVCFELCYVRAHCPRKVQISQSFDSHSESSICMLKLGNPSQSLLTVLSAPLCSERRSRPPTLHGCRRVPCFHARGLVSDRSGHRACLLA